MASLIQGSRQVHAKVSIWHIRHACPFKPLANPSSSMHMYACLHTRITHTSTCINLSHRIPLLRTPFVWVWVSATDVPSLNSFISSSAVTPHLSINFARECRASAAISLSSRGNFQREVCLNAWSSLRTYLHSCVCLSMRYACGRKKFYKRKLEHANASILHVYQ